MIITPKFAVGTTVKYHQTAEVMGNKTESEISYRLVSLTPEKAVIEMKTASVIMGKKYDMPATNMEQPAKIESTKSPIPVKSVKQKMKETEETITAAGKKLKCKIMEMDLNQQGATGTTKTWICDEVPGSLVKSESNMTKPVKTITVLKLTEIIIP